jgi:hypothetical protein
MVGRNFHTKTEFPDSQKNLIIILLWLFRTDKKIGMKTSWRYFFLLTLWQVYPLASASPYFLAGNAA